MKLILGLVTVVIVVVIAVLLTQGVFANIFGKTTNVTIHDKTYKVNVAQTQEEKEIGLSKKKSLSDNGGMLFTFDTPDYYPFWMKQMQMPIDIVYIRENKVVTIYANVQPPKDQNETPTIYKPEEPADAVLELKANTVEKNNIKKGDEVVIKS